MYTSPVGSSLSTVQRLVVRVGTLPTGDVLHFSSLNRRYINFPSLKVQSDPPRGEKTCVRFPLDGGEPRPSDRPTATPRIVESNIS